MQTDVDTSLEAKRRQAAARIHRLYARLRWSRCRTSVERAGFLLHVALQPVLALAQAAAGTWRYGRRVARVVGVSLPRQFLHQWAIGIRFGFDRDTYYRYKLYRCRDVRSAALFLPLNANMALRDYLYGRIGVDPSRLADKRRFYRTCLDHGLPVAQTIAEFEYGEIRWWPGYTGGVLPRRDLFSKQANNIKGRGAARWFWQGGDRYRDEEGNTVSPAELIAHLRAQSRSAPYVLQIRLVNHPLIGQFAPDTLCTVRVVTYRAAGGMPEHLASTFRMAGGSFPADNFSQGGLASPVDEATGELRAAVFKDLHETVVEHACHPGSGIQIVGFRLPQWDEVVELALRAHRMFCDFPSVGWDVAITPDGPVLIEGNYNWNVVITQQAGGHPLGETSYFDSYLSFLDQTNDGRQ